MKVTPNTVKQLHDQTGAGYMDAKRALEQTNGNFEKAVIVLREKGISIAKKKSVRLTGEGTIGFYSHFNDRVGVMVELNCETDFAASTDIFKNLAHDLAVHIAAMNPLYISRADIPEETIEDEKDIYEAQIKNEENTEDTVNSAVEERLQKYYKNNCLLDQPYFKDPGKSVNDLLVECITALKENITVKRFTRYEVGEEV
jgi:elongation factor Ts